MVQRLRLCTSTAGSTGLIPGQRTKIMHGGQCGPKKNLCSILRIVIMVFSRYMHSSRIVGSYSSPVFSFLPQFSSP